MVVPRPTPTTHTAKAPWAMLEMAMKKGLQLRHSLYYYDGSVTCLQESQKIFLERQILEFETTQC